MSKLIFKYLDTELHGVYVVCPRCEGHGKHTNPNIDGNGITAHEMDELGPDFERDYFNGVYDITCLECKGKRLIIVPCKFRNSQEELNEYEQYAREEAAYEAECAMELRMGC